MSARVSSLWAVDEDGETSKALTSSKEFVRRWQALDANGEVCATGEGPEFEAPACAVEVRVRVGAVLERSARVH